MDFFLLKELIQNGDDAHATHVTVSFKSSEQTATVPGAPDFCSLSVTNRGGLAFTEEGWERIVEIATGNPDENSVG